MRQPREFKPDERVTVTVAAEFEEFVPRFWNELVKNVGKMRDALKQGDFDTTQFLGHKTKGTARTLGLADFGDLGQSVELAAEANSSREVGVLLDEMESYLKRIEVVYE